MQFKNLKNKGDLIASVIFTVVFVVLFFSFNLNNTFFEPPQSVHIWRQTNSLSIVMNYYQYDLPFFEPEIHNQFCDYGHSGKTAGEFPIIYYVVAKIWKITGSQEWIFRFVQTLILFIGLWCLFQVLYHLFKNWFWAGFASLLLFTAPMLVFYGPNFLPDGPALGFVFIAWYFIMRFVHRRKLVSLWFAALFFSLSMLLKITSALSFIAFGGWIIYELLFQKSEKRIFNFNWRHFIPFFTTIISVLVWYLYVRYYNYKHHADFSYLGIWPVWNITKEQYARISFEVNNIYFKEFFLPYTQYLTFAIWLFLLIKIKKMQVVFRYFFLVFTAGLLMQLALWFQVLEGHDYYMVNLLATFVAVWAILFYQIRKWKYFSHPIFYLVGIAFFTWNVSTCSHRIYIRYNSWMNDMYTKQFASLKEIEPFFEKIGLEPEDKVISLPDFTINGSLYFMDRKGYTQFGSDFSKPEGIYTRIADGAKYLVVNDTTILHNPEIQPFIVHKLGEYKNIWVYDLSGIKPPE